MVKVVGVVSEIVQWRVCSGGSEIESGRSGKVVKEWEERTERVVKVVRVVNESSGDGEITFKKKEIGSCVCDVKTTESVCSPTSDVSTKNRAKMMRNNLVIKMTYF